MRTSARFRDFASSMLAISTVWMNDRYWKPSIGSRNFSDVKMLSQFYRTFCLLLDALFELQQDTHFIA
jgi:hypothetical protein